MAATVSVEVFDGDFRWQGTADTITALTAHRRHLGVSTATFELDPAVSDVRDALVADGAQVVILVDGTLFMSGWVVSDGGGVNPGEALSYEVEGHDVLLFDILGWPVPGNPLTNQNTAYWTMTGPAETVVKAAIAANTTRLGLPVTVAPTAARGATITASLRFHPIMDRIRTQLYEAGVGVTVTLDEGTGLLVDCYLVTEHTHPWDPESGVIVGGSWKRTLPSLTRVVAGSQGEAEARTFYGPEVASWEPDMAPRVVEGFVDARDVEGDAAAEATARMQEKLAESSASYDLDLTLDSTEEFAFGTGWMPGDVVPLAVRPDVTIPAHIDEAELTVGDTGVQVRPVVGAGDDPMTQALTPLIDAVSVLGRVARNQAVR